MGLSEKLRGTPFVAFRGEIVAVAGATRVYFATDDLDPASQWFVSVMCLCKREVDEGRLEGPFTSELAERWARLILIGPHAFDAGIDDHVIAARLGVPIDQVALARAEFGHVTPAFG